MKRTSILLAVAAMVLYGAVAVASEARPQTTCLVSGQPIDRATSPHVDWQGQRIYFCCNACPAKLKADPEAFFATAAAAGVVFDNLQATCPVSGEQLDEMGTPTHLDYKGRRVMFCCASCEKTFNKDPEKYLATLPGEQPARK